MDTKSLNDKQKTTWAVHTVETLRDYRLLRLSHVLGMFNHTDTELGRIHHAYTEKYRNTCHISDYANPYTPISPVDPKLEADIKGLKTFDLEAARTRIHMYNGQRLSKILAAIDVDPYIGEYRTVLRRVIGECLRVNRCPRLVDSILIQLENGQRNYPGIKQDNTAFAPLDAKAIRFICDSTQSENRDQLPLWRARATY